MTNGKAILVAMSLNLGTTSDQIEKACIDYGIASGDDYSMASLQQVNAAAASLLATYLMLKDLKEGNFAVTMNTDEIKRRIWHLACLSGGLFIVPVELKIVTPTVKQIRLW